MTWKTSLPENLERYRQLAASLLGCLRIARRLTDEDKIALFLSSRTSGGRAMPDYYLVYFLLVDLLEFPKWDKEEKVAWSVPVEYRGRLYVIEHRKMGLGIFEPQQDRSKGNNSPVTAQGEADSVEICSLIRRACEIASPYFEWRAEVQAKGSELNVVNHSRSLFERYEFFVAEAHKLKLECQARREPGEYAATWEISERANWFAQSAIEAFFSWTEHAFIHLAILQGKLTTGEHVRLIAASEWKAKFKAALDLNDKSAKSHYDHLLDLRTQIRNFLAHGSFGKRGEAFSFHSGAGAVPLLITESVDHPFNLLGRPATHDFIALNQIESFIEWLWCDALPAAKPYLESGLPSILTYAVNGSYATAMSDVESMNSFVEHLGREWDDAANMDW